jgi:hypothetical protein
MAVAEVFVRKTALLRTEKKGDTAPGEMFADESRCLFEAANRMLRLATADGGGSDNERAIRDGFGDCFEFFGAGEQRLRPYGGTCFAERQFVGIHDAKMGKTEVAHGAGSSADV